VNVAIGTQAVDDWPVTFGTVRRALVVVPTHRAGPIAISL